MFYEHRVGAVDTTTSQRLGKNIISNAYARMDTFRLSSAYHYTLLGLDRRLGEQDSFLARDAASTAERCLACPDASGDDSNVH